MTEAAATDWEAFRTRSWVERLRVPVIFFLTSLVLLAALSGPRLKQPSPDNHFVYLADSYLHGTLEMRQEPPHGNDWASYDIITLTSGDEYRGIWYDRRERKFLSLEGDLFVFPAQELRGFTTERKYFVSFPPMPAVLMLPGVAIWGFDFNDVWFTLFFAAMNVGLMYSLLRYLKLMGKTRLSDSDNVWLTVMYGWGTAHLWCSVMGSVWFTALIVGCTFALLYVRASIDAKHPFLAGLFLALGFATRTPMLFSVVFFAGFFFFPNGKLRRDFVSKEFWRDGLLFVSVPLVVGVTLMALNEARFHSASEFGHTYLANGQLQRIKDYGLFNVHFVSLNLTAMFAMVPQFLPDEPYVVISKHGLALWFTTPAFLYFLNARYPLQGEGKQLTRIAALTWLCIATPHIFYQNSGWVQFGYRFSCDYLAYLTILLAMGRERLTPLFKVAVVVGVLVNGFGAITFNRYGQYYANWALETIW